MPKSNFNFVKSINRSQGISLHQLSKFQAELQSQRLKTVHQKQIFKKQVKLSKQNELQIVKTIQNIQKQALILTNKCEQQKTKHQQLQTLVKKLQELLYQQKLEKYEDIINKKEPDEYQQQKKIMNQKQNKIQSIVQKLNASSYQVTKKIDQIRMLRSERSVFSVLFDKLQRQYFDVQFYYKQLAIERSLIQKIYLKSVDKWNQLQTTSNSSQGQLQNIYQNNHYDTNYQSPQNSQKTTYQETAIQSSRILIQNKFSPRDKTKVNLTRKQNSKTLNQVQFQERQKNYLTSKKKVLQIFHQFGIKDMKQFRQILDDKMLNNQDLFYAVEKLYDQIFVVQGNIKTLQQQNQYRDTNGDKKISLRSVHLKIYAADCQKQIQKTRNQVLNFKEMLQKLVSYDNDSTIARQKKKTTIKMHKRQGTEQSDKYSYAGSQDSYSKKIKKPLLENQDHFTFSQNYQQIRQIMTKINEKLIISPQVREKLEQQECLKRRMKKQKNRSFVKMNPKSMGRFNNNGRQQNENKIQNDKNQIKKQNIQQVEGNSL